ncbi:MAG: hypothetical protein ABI218_12350 [Caldimonas sp.]
MQTSIHERRLCRVVLLAALAAHATLGYAARVGGEQAPSPAAVQALAQQPAQAQADESASLRQGTITALDPKGTRLQVQGIWLEIVDGKTVAIRNGRAIGAESLKVGETIRFTVAPGSTEAASLRLIYAP